MIKFLRDPETASSKPSANAWQPIGSPPEIYDLVLLRFADGRTTRGTWNGKIWWGYDERVRRSCALDPTAWRQLWLTGGS